VSEREQLRRAVAIRVIELGRRLFANTPIQRWQVTTAVLRSVLRAGYGSGDVEVAFRGLRIVVPATDVTAAPGVLGGFYERLELDVFSTLARRSSLVVDVGGNIGLFTCVAASQMVEGSVITFEPVPTNLDYLRRNLELNGLAHLVEVVDRAVSDEIGTAPIYLAEGTGTHSLASAVAASARQIEVEVTTLDHWLGDRAVDLLKIDVEGFDIHVLRGGMTLLERARPTLFVEYSAPAMIAAGFEPTDLLRRIFDTYESVFLVDEPKRIFRPVLPEEVPALSGPHAYWNLIAVANPAHLELVEAAAGGFSTASAAPGSSDGR
jgi:FkbM family methyltransferase